MIKTTYDQDTLWSRHLMMKTWRIILWRIVSYLDKAHEAKACGAFLNITFLIFLLSTSQHLKVLKKKNLKFCGFNAQWNAIHQLFNIPAWSTSQQQQLCNMYLETIEIHVSSLLEFLIPVMAKFADIQRIEIFLAALATPCLPCKSFIHCTVRFRQWRIVIRVFGTSSLILWPSKYFR